MFPEGGYYFYWICLLLLLNMILMPVGFQRHADLRMACSKELIIYKRNLALIKPTCDCDGVS
jgi:hypothetical protein